MKYIEIDKNILVNPDSIDAVELVSFQGKPRLNIHVNGKKFVATVEIGGLLQKLKQIDDDTKQFWAGR